MRRVRPEREAFRSPSSARRPRPQHRRSLQGESRPARDLPGRRSLGLAHPARPDATDRPTAAHRLSLPLLRIRPPHPTPDPDPARPAPAGRRRRSTRTSAPGSTDHSDERSRHALLAGRRLHLLPRPRRAVGRVRVGAQPAAPALLPPAARFIVGGWSRLVDALERRARDSASRSSPASGSTCYPTGR